MVSVTYTKGNGGREHTQIVCGDDNAILELDP